MRQLTDDRSTEYPVRQNCDAEMAGFLTYRSTSGTAFPTYCQWLGRVTDCISVSLEIEPDYLLTVAGTVKESQFVAASPCSLLTLNGHQFEIEYSIGRFNFHKWVACSAVAFVNYWTLF